MTGRVFLIDFQVEVHVTDGALDFEERPAEAEDVTDHITAILDGAIRAARNAILEHYPKLGPTVTVDGVELQG